MPSRGRGRLVPRGRSGLSGGGYRAYLALFFGDDEANESFPGDFRTSEDPHGFGFQFFIGRRNERLPTIFPNQPPTVTLTAAPTTVVFPAECPPGTNPEPGCTRIVQLSARAIDPDGDTLLYTYSTTGGRVTGHGPNATLDLTSVATGAYTVTVEVDDGCGAAGFTSVTIVVIRSAPTSTSPSESASTGGSAPTSNLDPGLLARSKAL